MATVILQARMGSTRLRGKVLAPILQRPMLWYTIETLKRSPVVNRIVLAAPEKEEDEPLTELAKEWGIDFFRGSELDVLKRFYDASMQFKDDYYFRATGDNPIIDSKNPQRSLHYLIDGRLDYVAETGLPLGAVVEVFTREALERAHKEGTSPEDREHVTWYMKKSGTFNIRFVQGPPELSFPELRLTVDVPEDLKRVTAIIENLYRDGIPGFEDVITFAKKEKM
jgi:spore coat polysaccharide biosynthesis protein SpsF